MTITKDEGDNFYDNTTTNIDDNIYTKLYTTTKPNRHNTQNAKSGKEQKQ